MRHYGAVTLVIPAAAPVAVQTHGQQQTHAPVNFGAAVTHRDAVQAVLRVDPAALTERARAAETERERRENGRGKRQSEKREDEPGQHVDIEV